MSLRIILVTGANGALGTAIAKMFLEESPENFVWLGVHQQRAGVEALAAEYPGRCRPAPLDVTQPGAWQSAVAEILAAGGGHAEPGANRARVCHFRGTAAGGCGANARAAGD